MTRFNNLRDRLLMRLLSQPTRMALATVVFNDIDSEINHYICSDDPEHIAPSICRLADLIRAEEGLEGSWTAQLQEGN